MAEKAPNPNVNLIRTIIGGVTTAVLVAFILKQLDLNKPAGGGSTSASTQVSHLEAKEATTKAWKSYVADDNIYHKNTTSIFNELIQNRNLNDYEENTIKELHKLNDDLVAILKDEHLDNSFVTLLKRRQEINKDLEPKFKDYVSDVRSIMSDNMLSVNDKQQQLGKEDQDWLGLTKGILERHATELEDLSKVLNEKYGNSFSVMDFLVYKEYKNGTLTATDNSTTSSIDNTKTTNPAVVNPTTSERTASNSNLRPVTSNTAANTANTNQTTLSAGMYAGDWSNEGGYLYFDNKGFSWEWTDGNPTSRGSWRAYNNQMTMTVTSGYNTGYTWTFNLSDVTPTSFTMQLAANTAYTYHCVKYGR